MYQPGIARLPSLLFLFAATLILIALTEVAVRHYPAHNKGGIVQNAIASNPSSHRFVRRRPQSGGPSSPSPASPSITPAKAQVSPVDQANDNPTSEAPPQSVFLPVGNDQQKQAPSSPPVPEPTAPPSSDFLPVGPHFAPASSAFLPVGAGSQNPQSSPNPPNPAQNPSNPQNPANTPVVILGGSQPTPGAQGGGNEQSGSQGDGGGQAGAQNGNTGQPGTQNGGSSQSGSQNDGNGQSGAQPGVNSQSSPGSPSPGAQPAGNTPGATDVVVDASGHTVAVGSQPSNGPAQTPAPVVNGAFQAGSQINSPITAPITGTAVGETYVIGTDGQIVIDGSTFNTATPTTATLKDGKTIVVGPSGAVSIQDKAPATTYMYTLSPLDYVLGGFLPIIVAVIFTAPWHILASAIKEIEPFYQLHKPDGALAEKSLGLTYRASITAVSTISAIKNKHYFVWWSGLLSSIALILAPMSSETIFIAFLGTASCNPMKSRDNCVPQLSVFPPAARVVQGVLAFMAILTLGLIIGLARARSGIYTNPLSIAALTSLFQDQRAIEDFRRIRAYYPPTPKELCEALRSKSYRIGPYYDLDGNERYGLHSTDDSAPNDPTSSFLPHSKHHTSVSIHKVDDDFQRPTKRRRQLIHIWTHSATVGIFSAFVIGLLALMIYYNRFPNPSSFEHFMESGSFGVNFLFTAVAVILKMYWTLLDDDLRLNQPFRLLSSSPQPATHTLLSAPHNNPYSGLFHSVAHTEFLNAYFSLVAILCEPLIVCLANIPYKPTTNFIAYEVCTWMSVGIMVLMLVGIIWLLGKRWMAGAGGAGMRAPDCIGSVLWLICGSHMLGDFQGLSQVGKGEMGRVVRSWGKEYAMGGVLGVDGEEREGVDEAIFVRDGG